MFKRVRIQNFRQFRDLTLDNLAQINIITGQNNTGKTSLLEALFLLVTPTNPGTVLTIAELRGPKGIAVDGTYAWGYIFHEGTSDSPIQLEATRADGAQELLSIRSSTGLEAPMMHDGEVNGALSSPQISTSLSDAPVIEYRYQSSTDSAVPERISRLRVTDRGAVPEWDGGFKGRPFYFMGHGPVGIEDDARRFSDLAGQRRKGDVIEALRVIEPRLVDLDILALSPSVVAADLGAGPLVPATYMGQGFERLLAIVLALLRSSGGTLLIDEIDDGLHYSVLPGVWKAIVEAAVKHSVQLFVTTHSLEAINAAVEGSRGHEGSLAFYRLERRDGDIEVVTGEDSRLRTAVSVGAELR